MTNSEQTLEHKDLKRILQIILQLGLIAFIISWCFQILSPFFSPILWGMIIAITAFPMFSKLRSLFGGRGVLASVVITLLFLSVIIIPTVLLAESLVEGLSHFRSTIHEGKSIIPPPGENTKNWPSVTKPLIALWQQASDDLQVATVKYRDQVLSAGKFVLSMISNVGIGILQFMASIIIAGVFLAYAKEGGTALRGIFVKLAGQKGDELADISEGTVRSVVKGILGVALIQTLMAGLGFFLAGVPGAGLWTFFCLILAIVQIGAGPVVIPIMIYLFNTASTTTAVLFLIWGILVLVSDNILKPLLLGRGAPVPMLVVFLGAIGGFIASGLIGLFLGAVILSLGYKLFQMWIFNPDEVKAES